MNTALDQSRRRKRGKNGDNTNKKVEDDEKPEVQAAAGINLLPDPILEDILSRIPTKMLNRCKLVSKTWISIITSLTFSKSLISGSPICPGDMVEVASNEEGFFGSYFEAKVVAMISESNEYVVEYKTLVEDDLSMRPLREVVTVDEVRPTPPTIKSGRFMRGDVVDAFDNDGWWVGTVLGVNFEERYYVYFPFFMVGSAYHLSELRVHQDWDDGKWCLPEISEN